MIGGHGGEGEGGPYMLASCVATPPDGCDAVGSDFHGGGDAVLGGDAVFGGDAVVVVAVVVV